MAVVSAVAIAAQLLVLTIGHRPVAAAPVPPTVVLSARAASPIAPGAQALVDVAVRNAGETDAAPPVTLAIRNLPAGVTLLRAGLDLLGHSWDCSAGGSCTLVGPDGVTPASLEALEVAQTRLRLVADAGATIPDTVTLALSAEAGLSDPPADLSGASTTVELARLAPGVAGSLEVVAASAGMVAAQRARTTLRVTNLGPAPIGGAGATVVAEGVLPPGSSAWAASGAGWSCADSAGLPTCTWAGADSGVGFSIDPLDLEFRAPMEPADGAPLRWAQTVTHTPASGPAISATAERVGIVLPDRPPIASVFALPSGPPAVERGGTVDVLVGMAGSGLDDPFRDVEVTLPLPAGWSLAGATDPWSCAAGAGEVRCTRTADFGGDADSSTVLSLEVGDEAAPGPQVLVFTGAVGGPDAAPPSTDDLTIEVAVVGAPLPQLRMFHYPDPDTPQHVTDGRALRVAPGGSALLGLDIVNVGTDSVPAGTELAVAISLPDGVTIADAPGGSPGWSCSSRRAQPGSIATCTTTAGSGLVRGAATSRAKLAVAVAGTVGPGPQAWPLAITAVLDREPLRSMEGATEVTVLVEAVAVATPVFGLDVDVVEAPRVTRPAGRIEVTPSNSGAAALPDGWTFAVVLPADLTNDERKELPEGCRYRNEGLGLGHDKGKGKGHGQGQGQGHDKDGEGGGDRVECSSPDPLGPRQLGEPVSIPVRVPEVGGAVELVIQGRAAGAEDVTVTETVEVLPALNASAIATPDRLLLPSDPAAPEPVVILDGRASEATGATATWAQIVAEGDPVVAFEGSGPGEPATGLVARFVPPDVAVETTLRFQLTVADAHTSSSTEVVVVVEPPDAPQPDEPASASAPAGEAQHEPAVVTRKSQSESSRAIPLATSTGSGSWSWTVDPTISKNDLTPGPDTPVRGSRVRVLDHGQIVWNGPGPEPTDTTFSTEWQACDEFDPSACSPIVETGDVYIPDFHHQLLDAIITISGTDSGGLPVTTTEIFPLGLVALPEQLPTLVFPPSIEGTPTVGATLTANPGEWSLEYRKEFAWLSCAGPDKASCTEIPGATGETYVVQPADDGTPIRLRVRAFEFEDIGFREAISSAVQSGVVIGCGSDCYTWTVDPTIDRTGTGAPTPVTGFEARLVDDGTFAWNDPSSAPEWIVTERAWFECDASVPSACAEVGDGPTYTPATAGVLLEARLTVAGYFAVDGTVRTGSRVVPFGPVRDANAPPDATTPPSISGSPVVSLVLTADPGVWEGSPDPARTYEWFRCDARNPDQCVAVGVTTPTYTVVEADLTRQASVMRVDVTAPGYVNPGTARSAPTERLTANFKRLHSPPLIDAGIAGGPQVGVQAHGQQAFWSEMPETLSGRLDWQRCESGDASSCSSVSLGQGPAYVPGPELIGAWLRVRSTIVFRTLDGGSASQHADSTLIGPVRPAPIAATTDLPGGAASLANGQSLDVVGSATGGAPPLTYAWAQTSGPPASWTSSFTTLTVTAPASGEGTLGFRFTATDANGDSGVADITVEYGAFGAPPELCEAHGLVTSIGPSIRTLTYGDIELRFTGGSANGEFCTADTVVSIPSALIEAYDLLSGRDFRVTIDAAGVTIDGGGDLSLITGTSLQQGGLRLEPGLSLSIPFQGDGTYELVGALVTNGFRPPGVIDLFGSWTAATRLALDNLGGGQTISFGVVAWDSTFGAATPVPGQLPTPPASSPVIDLGGSLSLDGTFSFDLETTGLIDIAGAIVDFSGSIARDVPGGDLAFVANGSLAAPVPLAAGITLQSASLGWDGEAFTGSGVMTITVNGETLTISAGFDFDHVDRWRADLSITGGGRWTPVAGLALTNPTVDGSVQRASGGTRIEIAVGADAMTLGSGVELTGPALDLTATCGTGSCGFDLTFSADLVVSMFGGSLQAGLNGTLNTATGAFSAFANLGGFTIADGLSFGGATLFVERAPAGLTVELRTDVRLFGSTFGLTISYDDRGALVLVEVGNWTPFAGAPEFVDAWILFSSYAGTVMIGDEEVTVFPNRLQFAAHTGVPKWFADLIGDDTATADVRGFLGLSPLTFDFSLLFHFNQVEVFEVAGVRLTVDTVGLNIEANGTSFRSSIDGLGSLYIPSTGGKDPSRVQVQVGLFYQPTTGTIGGSMYLFSQWDNAFGVDGLKVVGFAVTVGLSLNGGVQLGFAGSVELPAAWSGIGVRPFTPVRLVAAIAGASSCFGIEIGTPNSPFTAIDVGNLGALTARHASLYIAPTGCDVGPVHIEPGIAMAFDGTILDVDVKVGLRIAPSLIEGSIAVGEIELGELTVDKTVVGVRLTPGSSQLSFSARATAFGVTADVSGEFVAAGGFTAIDFKGTFTAPRLVGFELEELVVEFSYVSLPFKLEVDASVSVLLLGQPQTVELSFSVFGGRVIEASGSADIDLTIGELNIDAFAEFEFKQYQFPTISFDGTASVAGRQLTAVSGSLQRSYLEFEAELNLGGIFATPPRLSGMVVWDTEGSGDLPTIRNAAGVHVPASGGDFRFDATNLGLNVSGLTVSANLAIGNVGGVPFADLTTKVNFGLARYASVAVDFRGAVDGAGNFTLEGDGRMQIGGVDAVTLNFAVTRQGNSTSVRAGATVKIPNFADVSVNGSFGYHASLGWLYTLEGSVKVATPAHDFGTGSFAAYRVNERGRAVTGMRADISVDIPDLAAGDARVGISSNGNLSFYAHLQTQGDLRDAIGDVTATVSFDHSPPDTEFSFRISVRDVMSIPGSFTLEGDIDSDGGFRVSVIVAVGPYSASKDLFFCNASASAEGELTVTIVSNATTFSIAVTIDGDASAGCGVIQVSVGLTGTFKYEAPSTFSLKLKARFDLGEAGSWNPTLYNG